MGKQEDEATLYRSTAIRDIRKTNRSAQVYYNSRSDPKKSRMV